MEETVQLFLQSSNITLWWVKNYRWSNKSFVWITQKGTTQNYFTPSLIYLLYHLSIPTILIKPDHKENGIKGCKIPSDIKTIIWIKDLGHLHVYNTKSLTIKEERVKKVIQC